MSRPDPPHRPDEKVHDDDRVHDHDRDRVHEHERDRLHEQDRDRLREQKRDRIHEDHRESVREQNRDRVHERASAADRRQRPARASRRTDEAKKPATRSEAPAAAHVEKGSGHAHASGAHSHDEGSRFSQVELRVKALESLLVDKGLVDPAALDALVETYETRVGPRNGARVVARAWSDPGYREWLLRDATAAIASLGYTGRQGEDMVVVENTDRVHNLVVCTLCSCYPWPVLGLPPVWYKSAPYRSRAVIDPRGVLAEFGVVVSDDVEVRVWDSTAEVRYLVLPQRPPGTEGWTEEQLAAAVTRDAMIGVAR